MQTQHKGRLAAAALLMGLAGAAQAHTGHGTHSLMEGLAHPFGLDHLLAMLAVGCGRSAPCRRAKPGGARPRFCWHWWPVLRWAQRA